MSTLLPKLNQHRRPAHPLHIWKRVVVCGVLLIALVISAALIYFKPGTATFIAPASTAPLITATDAPLYPPGTRYYYRRGQWLPLDQQP